MDDSGSYYENKIKYADCGHCEKRNSCAIFVLYVKVVCDAINRRYPIELAIKDATRLRDETESYEDGGLVSYLKAIKDGTLSDAHPGNVSKADIVLAKMLHYFDERVDDIKEQPELKVEFCEN